MCGFNLLHPVRKLIFNMILKWIYIWPLTILVKLLSFETRRNILGSLVKILILEDYTQPVISYLNNSCLRMEIKCRAHGQLLKVSVQRKWYMRVLRFLTNHPTSISKKIS